MLVNAILTYISIDGSLYSLHSQVILNINPFVLLHFLTDRDLHLATETEQDPTRLSLQYCPNCLKNEVRFKSGQKRVKNNHVASLI
jgi:hypothetical protein